MFFGQYCAMEVVFEGWLQGRTLRLGPLIKILNWLLHTHTHAHTPHTHTEAVSGRMVTRICLFSDYVWKMFVCLGALWLFFVLQMVLEYASSKMGHVSKISSDQLDLIHTGRGT